MDGPFLTVTFNKNDFLNVPYVKYDFLFIELIFQASIIFQIFLKNRFGIVGKPQAH